MQQLFEGIDAEMARVLRGKSPSDRLAIFAGMWRSAREMLQRQLRSEHPDWPDGQIDQAVAKRLSHGAY